MAFPILLATAATAQLVTLQNGDPRLDHARTTVSDAGRIELAAGGSVACYELGPRGGRKLACLTNAEWAKVLDDAAVIEKRWQLADRRFETAKDLNRLRALGNNP